MPPKTDTPPASAPETATTAPKTLRVRVVGQPVGELGAFHVKGDTFETTPDRRKALGPLVEDVAS